MSTSVIFRSTLCLVNRGACMHRCYTTPLCILGRQTRSHHIQRDLRFSNHLPSTLFSHRPCVLTSIIPDLLDTHRSGERHIAKWVNLRAPPPLSLPAIVQASPISWQPYMRLVRLDKPIGNWLIFLPSAWSLSLAAPPSVLPDGRLLALFALGACLMRGAGCTINDMWDRDYDRKVERTRDRPIASGVVTRGQALSFLAIQLSAALSILLSFDVYTIVLGSSCVLLVTAYPLMKRITYWPQLFLGVTLNWGVLIGWSAAHGGAVHWPAVTLYLASAVWSMIYDSIYSHQDKEDDILAGVKSTALRWDDNSKLWLSGLAATMTSGLVATGYFSDQTWPYYAGVAFVASHIAHQIYTVDLESAEDCGKKFKSNRNLGLVFWAAIIAANLHRSMKNDDKMNEVEEVS